MNSIVRVSVIILISCLLVSCASSGSGRLTAAHLSAPKKTVYFRPSNSHRAPDYIPDLTATLESAGFTVVSTPNAPYSVDLSLGGGASISCSIVLYKDGVPLISGRGVNSGFGTAVARVVAYDHVFGMALRQFERRLKGA